MKINMHQDVAKGTITVTTCMTCIKGSSLHVSTACREMTQVILLNKFDSFVLKA